MGKSNRREQTPKRFVRGNERKMWDGYKGGPHQDARLARNRRRRQEQSAIKESLEAWGD